MQPTKVKTSILTATGLISHTTEFRVEGDKYVANVVDGDRMEIANRNGVWELRTDLDGVLLSRDNKREVMLLAAAAAMHVAMCTD
jgi:hypothetical protein